MGNGIARMQSSCMQLPAKKDSIACDPLCCSATYLVSIITVMPCGMIAVSILYVMSNLTLEIMKVRDF